MWNTLPFEKKMQERLVHDFGDEKGNRIYNQYVSARDTLIADNFFSQINASEPSLSDHGERHIANVLDNCDKLLGEEMNKMSGMMIYCLGLVVLFHDTGNVFGRKEHNKNIAKVYNFVRKKEAKYNHERGVIIAAAEAHTGVGKDGSRDTLNSFESGNMDNLEGEPINLRDIACILRFADELAEGPQRTSQFMIENYKYAEESSIYHEYANIVQIAIGRNEGRISITLNIDVGDSVKDEKNFVELMEFACRRIVKLDEERRYNKHYCDLLLPFKKTSIKFNFWKDGSPSDIDIDKIELTDKFPIPGENQEAYGTIKLKNDKLDFSEIWRQLDA